MPEQITPQSAQLPVERLILELAQRASSRRPSSTDGLRQRFIDELFLPQKTNCIILSRKNSFKI
jgi:hypothetical protein